MWWHAQKPDFVFRAKRTSQFKSAGGPQFSRLLAAEVWASAVVMLDTPCSEVVWRVRATHYIRQFLLHFPSRASPCAITFQLESIWTNLRDKETVSHAYYWIQLVQPVAHTKSDGRRGSRWLSFCIIACCFITLQLSLSYINQPKARVPTDL